MTEYKLLELFKGTGSVGKIAKRYFKTIVSLDFDAKSKASITIDILNWDYKAYSKDNNFIPDFIWASPPCNTFSPLAYPLKERDTENAKPLSKRAKIGTKILYKTLEIIKYFQSKNPKMLFVIENPHGMMRKDAKMKKLYMETTLYCLYGDKRRKSTDFFSNFILDLKEEKQCKCDTVGVVDLKLSERYKIPSRLITHIMKQFFKYYD
jgi:site-specific DNA-cytosine methylase